jgi:uncharacterized protein YuzE
MEDPGYLNVRSSLDTPITRTVEIGGGINIDLNADGTVVGVEKVSGDITINDLTEVLRTGRFAESADCAAYTIADTRGDYHSFYGEGITVSYHSEWIDLLNKAGAIHFRIRADMVRFVERQSVPAKGAVQVTETEAAVAAA